MNCQALLLIELATSQCGTTPRSLSLGISLCINVDNNIFNRHLVHGIDYLIPSGLKESSIPFATEEVKKEIYLEDITKIKPIGADRLLITLKLNDEIVEAYCTSIEYGVIDEHSNRPKYWKSFINLIGPDIAVKHLNKHYKHSTHLYVDSFESSSILSIEPYIDKDVILESQFSDWRSPSSAKDEYSWKNIDKIFVSINRQERTITLSNSFSKSYTGSDHDGGFETTERVFSMSCTIKYGSLERLDAQLKKWEEKGFPIVNGNISFPHLGYWEIQSILGVKFNFSNSTSTYPA